MSRNTRRREWRVNAQLPLSSHTSVWKQRYTEGKKRGRETKKGRKKERANPSACRDAALCSIQRIRTPA